MTSPPMQGCPCSPALVLQGKWAEGEPKHPDGRGIFNRTGPVPDFVHRPGGFHSPYIGWWYMIHGGEHSWALCIRLQGC